MGMYTGLRGTIVIKHQYVDAVKKVVEEGLLWLDVMSDEDREIPEVEYFINKPRARLVLRGSVCYMPESWGEGFCKINGDTVEFVSSFKNYNDEIGAFVAMLPVIADYWKLEELYEENGHSTLHLSPLNSEKP